MAALCCDICMDAFSEKDKIPKMVECGHTFCLVCLQSLFQEQRICPTCKGPLTKSPEDCPTNFIVYKQTKISEESLNFISSHIGFTLKMYRKEFLKRKDLMQKSISERASLKHLIINDISKLQHMLEMEPETISSTDVENLYLELEDDLEKIDLVLYCCGRSNLEPTYPLSEYVNTSFYLYELANRLNKGEEIYAFEKVDSKMKYGKITFDKDRLNIQVLDLSSVDKKAGIVSFQDLRKCVTKQNFRTFIKLEDQTFTFTIVDSSFLALRFITLCSGENGPMFKRSLGITPSKGQHVITPENRNIQKQYLRTEKFKHNELEVENVNDYDLICFSEEEKTLCTENHLVVQMFPDGPCEIHKCPFEGSEFNNIVGIMTEPCKKVLFGLNPMEIVDCGISLIL